MVELIKVYDPKGEPFEVQHELASTLVLNKGWSKTTSPVVAPRVSPVFVPAPIAPVEVVETKLADRILASAQAHIADEPKK
jgi:hypothetical protein